METYRDFQAKALDPTLSANEKSGFADAVRAGRHPAIYRDIAGKLTALAERGGRVLDIGIGCSELAHHILAETGRCGQRLTVIDSPEVLSQLADPPHVTKIAGRFPDCLEAANRALGPFDAVLAYSVAQHVFAEASLFGFVDAAAPLLAEQGRLLLGDIPNASMRKRFMASAAGRAYHAAHYAHLPQPAVNFTVLDVGQIDDGVVLGLLGRMRAAGLQAFVVPQAVDLPMANRREDILIIRP